MEHRPAPPLRDAGHLREAVAHAGGEQHPPGPLAGAVVELEVEGAASVDGADDVSATHLDAGVGGELVTPGPVQRFGRATVVAEQTADALCHAVALLAGVHEQRATPRPAEDQRRAEAGGAAADDDAVPGIVHGSSMTVVA